MEFLNELTVWQLALITFLMRICDVSLGTVKTISVVQGRVAMAVVLGFFEVLIWVTVVAQVISHLGDYPILSVAYAGGYAAGNAAGILIERLMALGTCVVRFISNKDGHKLATTLRETGQGVTTFEGDGRDGHCLLIYAICPRKSVPRIVKTAQSVDPDIFYIVESVVQSRALHSIARQESWLPWMHKKK